MPNDTNGKLDVFVYRRSSDTVERLSTGPDGAQIADGGYGGEFSDDGRYMLFGSVGRGLPGVPVTASEFNRWFVKDLQTGAIQLLCRNNASLDLGEPTGQFGCLTEASISGDGRSVVFGGSLEMPSFVSFYQVYRADLVARTLQIWSRNAAGEPCLGYCGSWPDFGMFALREQPLISSDGKHVAFWARTADEPTFNMVPGVSFAGRLSQILVRSDGPIAVPAAATVLQIPTTTLAARLVFGTLLLALGMAALRRRQ